MLTLITKESCPYCLKAKKALSERAIEYTERTLGKDISRDDVIRKYPTMKNIPIALDGKEELIGGYTEIVDHIVKIMETRRNASTNNLQPFQNSQVA